MKKITEKSIVLKHDYIQIKDNGQLSYGGNQNWFGKGKLANYGCGLVAAGDILLYLAKTGRHRMKSGLKSDIKDALEKDEYEIYLQRLSRSFFYVPYLTRGIPGPFLSVGFNLKAFFHGCPLRATWAVPGNKVHRAIHVMLEKDIPVLFSVGANFPWFWKKNGVTLYQAVTQNPERNKDSIKLVNSGRTSRHYMTITGVYFDNIHGELLRVSSWGKMYYIKWEEYEEFMRRRSNGFFTNILFLSEK